jgi:hypothetical protein
MAAYLKSVKRNTQMRNRIKSFLSDHGVRLRSGHSWLNRPLSTFSLSHFPTLSFSLHCSAGLPVFAAT